MQEETNADYVEDYEINQGVIIAVVNFSPRSLAAPGQPLPDLRAWSDVVFLTWAKLCSNGGDIKSLKHVFRYHIKSGETSTLDIALEALGVQTADDIKVWPSDQPEILGQTFEANSDEGKALIGTPHGVGVGWLIWQHQGGSQLGRKTFDKVTVFKTTNGQGQAWVNIHYLLKDLE